MITSKAHLENIFISVTKLHKLIAVASYGYKNPFFAVVQYV